VIELRLKELFYSSS